MLTHFPEVILLTNFTIRIWIWTNQFRFSPFVVAADITDLGSTYLILSMSALIAYVLLFKTLKLFFFFFSFLSDWYTIACLCLSKLGSWKWGTCCCFKSSWWCEFLSNSKSWSRKDVSFGTQPEMPFSCLAEKSCRESDYFWYVFAFSLS